jgi:hypothetical protein
MKFDVEIPILPVEAIDRVVRSAHHAEYDGFVHGYKCSECLCTWPCPMVRMAATALHYAERCQELEEREEKYDV